MVVRNERLRFCGNNFTEADNVSVVVSSEQALFPATNLKLTQRYKVWSPAGRFEITAANNKLYYNDGSDQEITIPVSSSYTGTTLAAAIQSEFGAGYAVTFNADASWTISHTTTAFTLQLSNSTNAVWDTIGWVGSTDRTAQLHDSDTIRVHTSETVDWDLGTATEITFLAAIASRTEVFALSQEAVITLEADNVPIPATPALSRTLTVGSEGIFEFLDDLDDTTYRFWRLTIVDRTNTNQLKFGVLYLGSYITLDQRGLVRGFTKQQVDPSLKNTSESGAVFYKVKNRFFRLGNLSTPFLTADNRKDLEQFFYDRGNFKPFFISLDPTMQVSTDLQELTRYVRFDGDPSVVHVKTDVYSVQFNVVEDL